MWFKRLFRRGKEEQKPEGEVNAQENATTQESAKTQENEKAQEKKESSIGQGIYYLYMIIGLQLLFVFGILGVIMFIGKVISTPGWVFLLIFLLFAGSLVYIYRKAKKKFRQLKESLNNADLSNKNYEISIMGGMLTMRIEQNPNAPKLLAAPPSAAQEQIIDAETIEPSADHKRVHLS
ncbi:MAG: hypothetical protein AB9866_28155 [Syntrophobacteraceae bacterium]